jgi:hypothetical protein
LVSILSLLGGGLVLILPLLAVDFAIAGWFGIDFAIAGDFVIAGWFGIDFAIAGLILSLLGGFCHCWVVWYRRFSLCVQEK